MNALDTLSLRPTQTTPSGSLGPDAAREAAEQFEAMVIGELVKPMFEALDTDGLGGGGDGERMFRPMLVERYAEGIAARGGVGLSDAVEKELLKLQEMAHGALG